MAAVLACARGNLAGATRPEGVDDSRDGRGAEGSRKTVLALWGATLSHRSAAVHWGLLPARDEPVDVTVRGGGGTKKRRGIRLHRSSSLLPAAVTLRRGIPVTTPARTLADLRRAAATSGERRLVSREQLRRATRQADVLGLPIGSPPDRDRTRSELERDFLRLCRRHRLPPPEVNVRVGRHLVDFLWRERRLVVETDGFRYHRGEAAFEDDHKRDLDLRALGHEVMRFSGRQVEEEPARIARLLAEELSPGTVRRAAGTDDGRRRAP